MSLGDFLLQHTKVGDLVLINNEGWYNGCTIIDHEDLFINSLNPKLLKRNVISHTYEEKDWTTKPVIVVEIG